MIVDRILQIIDYKGINKNRFYKETNLSNGFLDKVKDIGTSKIEQILNAYPEINPEWLLTGRGKMLRANNQNTNNESAIPENTTFQGANQQSIDTILNHLQNMYQENKEIHNKLITTYESRITEFKEEVSFLREQLKNIHVGQDK